MSGKEERSEELNGLEAALAALVPRVEGFDRERLIFEAGRASAMAEMGLAQSPSPPAPLPKGEGRNEPRRRWAWPAALAAMTAVAAMLLVMVISRPGPQIVRLPAEPSAPSVVDDRPQVAGLNHGGNSPPVASDSAVYDRRLRQRLLMHGIDLSAEPAAPRTSGIEMVRAPTSMLQLERELIEASLNPLGDRT
jgi:hypothetical protein